MSGAAYPRRAGPRPGSWAHQALAALHKAGGRATVVEWMKAVGWPAPTGRFNREVTSRLLEFRLIEQDRLHLVLADAGLRFLGVLEAAPVEEPVIAPAPYAPPARPLSQLHRPRVRVMRPGAFDYRDIPSLHFGTEVPFKSSVKLEHEVANG